MRVYLQLESIIHRRNQAPNLDWEQTPANSLRKEKLAKSFRLTVAGESHEEGLMVCFQAEKALWNSYTRSWDLSKACTITKAASTITQSMF